MVVEHCIGPLASHLLVKPRRHVTRVSELTVAEAAELGTLLQRSAQVVDRLVAPEQVYTCQWSQIETYQRGCCRVKNVM